MSIFISKQTIQRLIQDVKQIIKNPLTDQGIYYIHDDTDMMKGFAMIVGPSDTPYFGGFYFFEFNFPENYPHSPPKVIYHTNGGNIRFNPNLYCSGKVCISLLNTWKGDQWTSCQTISTILLTLCTILCDKPLLNEPGVNENHPDFLNYNKIIEYSNINIAICDIVSKKIGVYQPFFNNFYCFIKEHFIINYDKLLDFLNKKLKESTETIKNIENTETIENTENTENIKSIIIKTDLYKMNVIIEYDYLIEKFKQTKEILQVLSEA